MKNFLSIVNLLLLLAIAAYIIVRHNAEKRGFVMNQRIFDEFKGKKELEQRLTQLQHTHKVTLDSIALLIQGQPNNKGLMEQYRQTSEIFQLQQQELSQRYTAEVWKRINQYVSEYGKEKGYTYILGATGDGGLMYADEANNITEEVITHINKKYEAGN